MATIIPINTFKHLTFAYPFLYKLQKLHNIRKFHALACLQQQEDDEKQQRTNHLRNTKETRNTSNYNVEIGNIQTKSPLFPKRGQMLELECESLAFKGKGVCKVADTGFVVMCDRALPGEKFIGRVTRRKGSYAEVTKVKTISPHLDLVDAPCEYAPYCGGCKTQNLTYEAQLRAKEQQVRELVVHVGKFSDTV